jgi:hypothetical protein
VRSGSGSCGRRKRRSVVARGDTIPGRPGDGHPSVSWRSVRASLLQDGRQMKTLPLAASQSPPPASIHGAGPGRPVWAQDVRGP